MSAERQETREAMRARILDGMRRGGRVLTRADCPAEPLKPGEESMWDAIRRLRDRHDLDRNGVDLELPERLPPREPPTFE